MCIRDSSPPIFILSVLSFVCIASDETVKVLQSDTFTKYESCLLYTSDAADERSSVDLGGRRIIKKKKKTKHKRLYIHEKTKTNKHQKATNIKR